MWTNNKRISGRAWDGVVAITLTVTRWISRSTDDKELSTYTDAHNGRHGCQVIIYDDGSSRGKAFNVLHPLVCASVYFYARYLKNQSSQNHQTWHSKCPKTSPGNSFICVVKRSRLRVIKHCRLGSLHSSEYWLLLLVNAVTTCSVCESRDIFVTVIPR